MTDVRSPRTGQRGQGMAELALVLPLLIAVVLAIADFGMYYASRESLARAVRDGARYGAVHPAAWSNATVARSTSIEGIVQAGAQLATVPNDDAHIVITYRTSAGTLCGQYSAASNAFVAASGYTQGNCIRSGGFVTVSVTGAYTPVTTTLIRPGSVILSMTETSTEIEE